MRFRKIRVWRLIMRYIPFVLGYFIQVKAFAGLAPFNKLAHMIVPPLELAAPFAESFLVRSLYRPLSKVPSGGGCGIAAQWRTQKTSPMLEPHQNSNNHTFKSHILWCRSLHHCAVLQTFLQWAVERPRSVRSVLRYVRRRACVHTSVTRQFFFFLLA